MYRRYWLCAAAGVLLGPAAATAQPSWELSAGADYSVGRYGAATDTKVSDATLGARVQIDRLRLEGVVPFVWVDGPGELIGGVLVGTGGSSRRSGLGDITTTASWLLAGAEDARPAIETTATLKWPTAKAGIGTGKADFGAGLNLYRQVTPKVMLFGAIGYSWLTDSATYALSNGATATAAVSYRPREADEIGLSLGYRQSVAPGYSSQASLIPYWTRRIAPNIGLSAYVSAGLTSDSPRLATGLALKFYR